MPGSQGNVVEQAESHAVIRRRMVAGRPNQAQGCAVLSRHDCVDGGTAGSCRPQRNRRRSRTYDGVCIKPSASASGEFLDRLLDAWGVRFFNFALTEWLEGQLRAFFQ